MIIVADMTFNEKFWLLQHNGIELTYAAQGSKERAHHKFNWEIAFSTIT